MDTNIFNYLKKLGMTSDTTRTIFHEQTRDKDNLIVWRDEISGVIYIDGYYVGDNHYKNAVNADILTANEAPVVNFQDHKDNQRRFSTLLKLVSGKTVVDFGCGAASFLKSVKPHCEKVIGVELRDQYLETISNEKITCLSNLDEIAPKTIDVFCLFHVLEHLPRPWETLAIIRTKLKQDGVLILEVPHAKDFLLCTLKNEDFKKFTLWSEHLILHTRESLFRTIKDAGYSNIKISGVQRYPLSNHFNWLTEGKPGGHTSTLSVIDDNCLTNAYENTLSRLDATDTLLAVVSK